MLDDRIKLKLVKYNKNLQNKININIINYKIFSERYIIYETKEKVKEYEVLSDNLIFEGEYLNGKRNGKGKEDHWHGGLKFEGEYLKGKKWNGIEFDAYNKMIYGFKDGEKLIKLKNMKQLEIKGMIGKEYNEVGNLIFEGEYNKGNKWDGKVYNKKNNIIYEIKDGKG